MESLINVAQRCEAALSEPVLEVLARGLGVAPSALRALACGVAEQDTMRALSVGFGESEDPYPSQAFTFPERDATGALVGITFRDLGGRKGTPLGSKRGLVYPATRPQAGLVLIVEGPSDAAAGLTLGLDTIGRASCSTGAEDLAALPGLRERQPIVLADSDGPGIKGAKKLTQELANRWKQPVVWTQLPEGHKDLRAYVQALGLDVEDADRCAAAGVRLIEELQARARAVKPVGLTTCFADIETKPLRWLLHPCLPQGKLAILAGHPGLGKSLVSLDMAARLSRGAGMDGERTPECPMDALLLSAEDDPEDTVRPRLEAAGAALDRVHTSRCLDITELSRLLDERPNVRLVVLDPLSAYVGQVDTHKDAQVRTLLAPFVELASDRGVTLLFIAHLKKSEEGDAILRPGGSIAFVAAARIGWIVLKDPQDPQRRYCVPLKNNLGPDAYGFAYRVQADGPDAPPRIAWESARVTDSADEILAASRRKHERAGRGEALEEACGFLSAELSKGPQEAADVFEAAKACGVGKPSLKRAKSKLGVQVRKQGMDGGWIWTLPGKEGSAEPATEGDQQAPGAECEPLRQEAVGGSVCPSDAAPENGNDDGLTKGQP